MATLALWHVCQLTPVNPGPFRPWDDVSARERHRSVGCRTEAGIAEAFSEVRAKQRFGMVLALESACDFLDSRLVEACTC